MAGIIAGLSADATPGPVNRLVLGVLRLLAHRTGRSRRPITG